MKMVNSACLLDFYRFGRTVYQGPIVQVDTPAGLDAAAADILAEPYCGFDTEAKPTFIKGEAKNDPCLFQIATSKTVWLLHLKRVDATDLIRTWIENPILKAGFGIKQDLQGLRRLYGLADHLDNMIDVGKLAKRNGHASTGLKTLAAVVFQVRIQKRLATSNWERYPLNADQVVYAATDAWMTREIFLHFHLTKQQTEVYSLP